MRVVAERRLLVISVLCAVATICLLVLAEMLGWLP